MENVFQFQIVRISEQTYEIQVACVQLIVGGDALVAFVVSFEMVGQSLSDKEVCAYAS